MKVETKEIKHNLTIQKGKNAGNPIKSAAGRIGSFFASCEYLPTYGERHIAPINASRGQWSMFFAGGKNYYSVACVRGDLYSVSWVRPKGTFSSFSDVQREEELVKTVRFICDIDPREYLANIMTMNDGTHCLPLRVTIDETCLA